MRKCSILRIERLKNFFLYSSAWKMTEKITIEMLVQAILYGNAFIGISATLTFFVLMIIYWRKK